MIAVDTTFLSDLWRSQGVEDSPARRLVEAHPGDEFVVPAHAAGEFLEGGARVSPERLSESLQFLRLFRVGAVDLETALRYARLVAELRAAGALEGRSKPDLWIAAWAAQHAAPLATRDARHFEAIRGVELLGY